MSYSLSFRPEVENDAISGYVWYEEKARGFVRRISSCVLRLCKGNTTKSASVPKGIQ